MSESLLTVDELQIELITDRGVVRAVDGVSFTIAAGETVCIIGESGSGKSTTAMGLLGLLPTDLAVLSGRARWKSADILGDDAALRRVRGSEIALIPQDPMTALSPVHTIGSQLREAVHHGGIRGKSAQTARAVELLERVHIVNPADQLGRYPHQLSGGMLQRVLIACALAADPALIVADEPTSALDVTVQASILDLLLELQERTGIGMLLITHDLGVARLMSDRIHVMKSGTFVESGDARTLVDDPTHAYTRKLLGAVPQLGDWSGAPATREGVLA
ncbi:ABC transporter ATP-binding protein [Rhodococcoides corynebacterioides]|uniref:ABC transporter ATP-binding protein n=1 Tax=Rhodococcoides corynebacterioides TaxID=53972 RepID=A0ABS7P5M0_9NOCA|nr:ABC transporter ATP-binding protein [Rhodococcus corynebacterioides]MBY6366486.1 ABC transporter ATP-binding protein [Rhodococcus corynebacterioides]MBY6407086.1 ABC transporter ATP-binding protein [Rhodococcus corynebacterioides]